MRPSSATSWIARLQRWAENDANIRLALVVGSQARKEVPADSFSDIDVAVFARDPDRVLRDEGWISGLGLYWTSHTEGNALDSGEERRVLFQDGQDVDFAVFPVGFVGLVGADARAAKVLQRGFRTLVNKDSSDLVVPGEEALPVPPTWADFSNLVNDYWFHLIWTAKKLRRGELLTALEATNGYLRMLLVRTARWHALVHGPSGRDLWHGARFFERWADPRAVRDFSETVAGYEAKSIADSLRGHRTLFLWLSDEVAQALRFRAPIQDRAGMSMYLDRLLDSTGL
ncbi:MAG: aminoglycoside 6-adenylyltransferase [Thermoplasmata archaeon]|nr:aminoglycoside 6-adenylyltransferase [Thermoplasmata archaeon]